MKNFFKDKRVFYIYFVTILLFIIGVTYALQTASLSLSLTTALIGIDEAAYGSTTFDSSNLDFLPILDTEVETNTDNVIKIDFTVGGASSNVKDNIIYDIALNDLDVNCNLLSPFIKWKLVKDGTELSSGSLDYTFDTIDEDGRLVLTTIQQDLPDYSATQEGYADYTFYMWFSDSCQDSDLSACAGKVDQSALIGQNLSGKVEVELYTESKKTLVRNPGDAVSDSKCSSNEYEVTFMMNGGTSETITKTIVIGSPYGELPTPTRVDTVTFETNGGSDIVNVNSSSEDAILMNTSNITMFQPKVKMLETTANVKTVTYTFDGWYLDEAFTQLVTSETIVEGTQNQKLYAKWSGDNTITLPSVTKTNNSFLGWYRDSSLQTKVGVAGDSYEVFGSHTLYAKWASNLYTVTYDNNIFATYDDTDMGGSGLSVSYNPNTSQITLNGTVSSDVAFMQLSRTFVEGDQYRTVLDYVSGSYTATGSCSLGTEVQNSGSQLSTRIYTDMGLPTSTDTSYTDSFTVTEAGATNGNQIAFWLWVDSANSATVTFTNYVIRVDITKIVTASIAYGERLSDIDTSDYNKAYTVTFNANSGTVSPTTSTANYVFGGYYSGVNGTGTQYHSADGVAKSNWNIEGDGDLYAKWTTGTSVTLPTPTRTGYIFSGWYTAASGGTKIGDAGGTYIPTYDQTLYAHWTAKTVKVIFYRNTSSTDTTTSTQTFTYGVSGQKFNVTFTRSGYTGVGLATTSDATSTKYTFTNSVSNSWIESNYSTTVKLYAIWRENVWYISSSGTYQNTLANAISTATAGATLTLQKNKTDNTGTISKNLTINTNGKTWTRSSVLKINSGVTATIKGSGTMKNTSTTTALISNYGTLTVNHTGKLVSAYSGIVNHEGGILKITTANIDVTSGSGNAVTNVGQAEITDGTYKSIANTIRNGTTSNPIGVLWIKGGTYTMGSSSTGRGAIKNESDEIWPTTSTSGILHYCSVKCSVHITGDAQISNSGTWYGVQNDAAAGTGKIHFPAAFTGYVHAVNRSVLRAASGNIVMNGGTIYAESGSAKNANSGFSVTLGSDVVIKYTAP